MTDDPGIWKKHTRTPFGKVIEHRGGYVLTREVRFIGHGQYIKYLYYVFPDTYTEEDVHFGPGVCTSESRAMAYAVFENLIANKRDGHSCAGCIHFEHRTIRGVDIYLCNSTCTILAPYDERCGAYTEEYSDENKEHQADA